MVVKSIYPEFIMRFRKIQALTAFALAALLPLASQARLQKAQEKHGETGQARAVADYIAGMTDRFAIAEYDRLFDPHGGSV